MTIGLLLQVRSLSVDHNLEQAILISFNEHINKVLILKIKGISE